MTLLQRICADMVNRQDQLGRLHHFDRARRAGRFHTLPGMVEEIREVKLIHESDLARCAYFLRHHAAANDATTLPGAA